MSIVGYPDMCQLQERAGRCAHWENVPTKTVTIRVMEGGNRAIQRISVTKAIPTLFSTENLEI